MKLKLEAKRTILKLSYTEFQDLVKYGSITEKILLASQQIQLNVSIGDSAHLLITPECSSLDFTCVLSREQLCELKDMGKNREGLTIFPSKNGAGQFLLQIDLRSDRRKRV